jgi:dihydropyrimidinase
MIMSDVTDDTLKEMDQLVSEGIGLQAVHRIPGCLLQRRRGDLPGDAADREERRADHDARREQGWRSTWSRRGSSTKGKTDPYYHGVARYPIFEGEATNRVIRLAEAPGVPVCIVHLSARDALDAVRRARDRGSKTFAETCPSTSSSASTTSAMGSTGRSSHLLATLRPKDHWDELWTGLVKDDLQLVSTDPLPVRLPWPEGAGRGDFGRSPTASPGVEDRVDLLHDGGVVAGGYREERWVEVISTAPAKLFGMYPKKGAIAVGSDADIVVYDPSATRVISAKTHHMDVDYSCYEGRSVQGRSDIVLSRGSVIVRDGEFTGRKGAGKFVKRAPADFARLS